MTARSPATFAASSIAWLDDVTIMRVGSKAATAATSGVAKAAVRCDLIPERAMKTHMRHALTRSARNPGQGTELVGHHGRKFARLDLHDATAKPLAIREADMRADVDAARRRLLHGARHDQGIAGVKSAGDVRRRHEAEQGVVIAHCPGPEALGEIGVEIDRPGHDAASHSWSSIKGVPYSTAAPSSAQ